ncbi:MAG TPA: hypothetical protein VID03_05375 [Acidimicrobiia bacterium]
MTDSRPRLLAITLMALATFACGGSEATVTTGEPPPATEAEMATFCEKYETVRSQSWGEMTAALIEVSPDEIKAVMIRASEPPGETWFEDRQAAEEFMARCDA